MDGPGFDGRPSPMRMALASGVLTAILVVATAYHDGRIAVDSISELGTDEVQYRVRGLVASVGEDGFLLSQAAARLPVIWNQTVVEADRHVVVVGFYDAELAAMRAVAVSPAYVL